MEKGSDLQAESEPVTLQNLRDCMVLIIGTAKYPVDILWMRHYLPKPYEELYKSEILSRLSEEYGWHFISGGNKYIAEQLEEFVEPVHPFGYRLNESAGEAEYIKIIDQLAADRDKYPHLAEIIDSMQSNTSISPEEPAEYKS